MHGNQGDIGASVVGFLSVQLSALFGIIAVGSLIQALVVGFFGAVGGYFGKKAVEYTIKKIKEYRNEKRG